MRNKSSRKKFFPTLLILISLVFIITLGIFAYNKYVLTKNLRGIDISKIRNTPTGPVVKFKELPDYSDITSKWILRSIIFKDGKLSFKLPPDWKNLEFWNPMPPNAYGVQSPDFKSERGFGNIFKGSTLAISIDSVMYSIPTSLFRDMTIDQVGETRGSLGAKIVDHFKVAGLDAAKYMYHGGGENQNTVEGIIFRKDENGYQIEQDYHLNSLNPYPELLEQVASTIIFSH